MSYILILQTTCLTNKRSRKNYINYLENDLHFPSAPAGIGSLWSDVHFDNALPTSHFMCLPPSLTF